LAAVCCRFIANIGTAVQDRVMSMSRERALWSLFEPVHAVCYFTPQGRDAFTAAGLRGFWRGYFAGRAAPLGAVGAPPVLASFFSFAPSMVTRALPAVWTLITPADALRARADGAVAALEAVFAAASTGAPADVVEAAELMEQAVAALEPAGRVLGAANQAVAPYQQPLARLWQAATTLREHRGDGHNAALVAAGIGPLEALALRCGMDINREHMQAARGWTDEEWVAGEARAATLGLIDASGKATPDGRDTFQAVEDATDRAAAPAWDAVGPVGVRRLTELLTPFARACSTVLPVGNPIGLPIPA
jgi:hypothetical protein